MAQVLGTYERGQFKRAAKLLHEEHEHAWKVSLDSSQTKMRYPDDAVITNLEFGRVLFDAGKFPQAIERFETSEAILNQDFHERAVVSARDAWTEAESLLTNQRAMPYSGFVYDRVMLNVYKSLASALSGDLDRAAVEARRVDGTQEDAIRVFRHEVKGSERASSEWEKVAATKQFANKSNLAPVASYPAAYADFVNPFATLAKGVVRRIRNHTNESAEVDFRNLASMMPDHPFVAEELAAIQRNEPATGKVYVLWENGMGPQRKSVEVVFRYGELRALSLGFEDELDWFDSAFLALPAFVNGRPASASLTIQSSEASASTSLVCDMNEVERFEYDLRMPTVLLRELARVTVQETLANAADQSARKKDRQRGDSASWSEVLTKGATLLYRAAVNLADDRCWRTLPANFGFAVLSVPADRMLRLSHSSTPATSTVVELPAGDTFLLVVRSTHRTQLSSHVAGFRSRSRGTAVPTYPLKP